jgi:hypothetical protein
MKDSVPVYRKRAVDALNKIVAEIPESVLPMRREMKTDYGILLVELGDEKNGKAMLDKAMSDNAQYAKYFARWEEEYNWARMEVGNSKYLMNRIIEFSEQKGKKDWAARYKQMTPM